MQVLPGLRLCRPRAAARTLCSEAGSAWGKAALAASPRETVTSRQSSWKMGSCPAQLTRGRSSGKAATLRLTISPRDRTERPPPASDIRSQMKAAQSPHRDVGMFALANPRGVGPSAQAMIRNQSHRASALPSIGRRPQRVWPCEKASHGFLPAVAEAFGSQDECQLLESGTQARKRTDRKHIRANHGSEPPTASPGRSVNAVRELSSHSKDEARAAIPGGAGRSRWTHCETRSRTCGKFPTTYRTSRPDAGRSCFGPFTSC